ncbi:uncharacterized protein LOC131939748 [Physella acuta]|uniref:uncharacterized protein LOC131939748 n=1 Tax=Physella acuta TaxID=109671 RepID=UPI0027DC608C|nr:uncharacterized protein LOC131939748 [Physella acuta]
MLFMQKMDSLVSVRKGKDSYSFSSIVLILTILAGVGTHQVNGEETIVFVYDNLAPGCWPRTVGAENGLFVIEQVTEFSLECMPGMTRPFGSQSAWTCNTTEVFRSRPLYPYNGSYIPKSCVKILLPLVIYLVLEVAIETDTMAACDETLTGYRTSTSISVGDMVFLLDESSPVVGCQATFDKNGAFSKIRTSFIFRMNHHLKSPDFPRTTLSMAQAFLREHITQMITRFISKTDSNMTYTFGEDQPFRVGKCPEGSGVEVEENHFTDQLPICRMCEKGMYFDKFKHSCVRCDDSYTLHPGAVSCTPCPVVTPTPELDTDTLTGCYLVFPDSETNRMISFRRGALAFIIFHGAALAIFTWSVRNYIRNVQEKIVSGVSLH